MKRGDLILKKNPKKTYNFCPFETTRTFGRNINNHKITLDQANDEQSDLVI